MPEPNFSTSDVVWAKAARIDLDDCPQCAASREMERFHSMHQDRLAGTAKTQALRLLNLERLREIESGRHRSQLHVWKLLAFAGWFVVAIGLITKWWR